MKKSVLALVFFIVSLFSAREVMAQNPVFNNPDNYGYWGVRATFDVALPGKWKGNDTSVKMYKPGLGFSVGGYYNLPVVANLYFEPGVSLYYDTYKFDEFYISDASGSSEVVNEPIEKFGVRIPLVFGYRFDIWENASLAVYTGPELNIGLIGRIDYDEKLLPDENFGKDVYNDFWGHRRFDCAWKVGVAIPVSNFEFGIDGSFGLCNLMKEGRVKFHENRLSVAVAYRF